MKIYVVTAGYCEDTSICGVALDYATAERIHWHEENRDGFKPDWVGIDEYETDDYLPMNAGMKAYEVSMYPDGTEKIEIASLCGFENNRVGFFGHSRSMRLICYVYAKDEESASQLAADLRRKYIADKISSKQ